LRILAQTRTFSKPNNSRFGNNRKFNTRLKTGHTFEDEVADYFKEELSLILHPCGLDYKSPEAKSLLIKLNGPTSQHIRFEPDYYTEVPELADIIYVEAKTQITKTANCSIGLEQFNELYAWYTRGILTLYTFPPSTLSGPLLGEWVQNIDQIKSRTVTNTNKLTRVNGSRKPFILIPKSKLRDIKNVLSDLPGSNPEDIPVWEKAYQIPRRLSE